jgi:hypothetical protein
MDPIDEQLQIEYEYMQGEFIEDEDEVVIDDTDSEEESDNEYNENLIVMYYDEEEYRDSDKMNKKLYIGLPGYVRKTGNFVLLSCVSAKTFHRYNIDTIIKYLTDYSCTYVFRPVPHLLYLDIDEGGDYTVIIKTVWLRIIQRKWKRICRIRRWIESRRFQLQSIRMREIKGQLYDGTDAFCYPTLRGMLHELAAN